jgi:hypothetical protein
VTTEVCLGSLTWLNWFLARGICSKRNYNEYFEDSNFVSEKGEGL